jgi:hypothetical protein
MRREPPITFRGALQLFGRYERPLIGRLDRMLGGVILGAGALATVPALAPLAPIWGWIDQKNEATGLLRTCLDRVQSRLSGVHGYERVELVTAAHTMIVLSACFEVVQEAFQAESLRALRITETEQAMLAAGRWRDSDESLLSMLWAAEVPMPNGTRGFTENLVHVRDWAEAFNDLVRSFVEGLDGGSRAMTGSDFHSGALANRATARYQSHYLRLASMVPDFWIWSQLGEHAATRSEVAEVAAAFEGSDAALSRIESLLATMVAGSSAIGRPGEALARANRDVLSRPLVQGTVADDHAETIRFPTVEESYINPSYRLTVADRATRSADESWWDGRPVRRDLDLMITTQLTTFDGTRRPLLLLGHPGGGKSMLTKILAARLPKESYTVVRVPLRQVVANAPIHDQIRQALELATHGRAADWFELAEDGARTVRIVLLDGLDELLQATTHDRSGFLTEVVEFQRVEAAQERPVMVVVTSRTVVAERVDIPPGTPIAKLEEFDDDQIGRWLTVWNRANAAAGDQLRPLTREAALAHPEIAGQPLLLLMLAIYWSDPEQVDEGGNLSLTSLYQRLLTSFAVREVRKKTGSHLRGDALDRAVADQLYRLSVAAIGMFNRGRQDITELELGADLHGLDPDSGAPAGAESAGQRVLGEFFFVHAAEARMRQDQREVRRCYEFLHATFGEYLIASLVVETLADVADAAFGGARGPRKPSDDFLHSLLSHQTMASRRPILTFAGELLKQIPDRAREQIARILELLVQGYDRRVDARRYRGYRPLPESNLRPLAAYSANLILLRTLLDDEVPLSLLCPEHDLPLAHWRNAVNLWRAGLDPDGWQTMLDSLTLGGDVIRLRLDAAYQLEFSHIMYARLIGDRDAERQLRLGGALHPKVLYYVEGEDWGEMMASWLIPATVLPHTGRPGFILAPPPPNTPLEDVKNVLSLMSDAFLRQARYWSLDFMRVLMAWLSRNELLTRLAPVALAAAIDAYPVLIDEFEELQNPGLYDDFAKCVLWSVDEPAGDHWDKLLSPADFTGALPAHMKTIIRRLVRWVTASPEVMPFPATEGHSILAIRESDDESLPPLPLGSMTGSLRAGQTLDPDSPLPRLLE